MGRPETPLLATDVIITLGGDDRGPVVLVERASPPAGWALPGGFVEVGETVEAAALREAREETGLAVEGLALFGVYSDPARDPRGHTVTVVFTGTATGEPVGGDDARRAEAFELSALPGLAFDHARILADFRASGRRRDAGRPMAGECGAGADPL